MTIELDSDVFTKYFDASGISFTESLFEGIVIQKSVSKDRVSYQLVAPSALLTRNECTISIEDETGIRDVVSAIAPGFSLELDDDIEDETYENADSVGQTIMDVLQDIADTFEKKVYVRGKTIYIKSEISEETHETVELSESRTKADESENIGGSDAYTLIIARADIDGDTVELKERIIEADSDLVDVITPEDDDDVDSEEKLQKFLSRRVKEVKRAMFTKQFQTLFDPRILPGGKIKFQGVEYDVLEVEHRLSPREWLTVVKACRC